MKNIRGQFGSGQDGGIGRNASLPQTTKRKITNLKTINNQNSQNSNLHGTPTTKELKKHSSRLREGQRQEMGSWVGGENPPQGSRHPQARKVWVTRKLKTQNLYL